MGGRSAGTDILPVSRSKQDAILYYDRISKYYDFFAGILERRPTTKAIKGLHVTEGEVILEIGCGPGHCLEQLAYLVGDKGKVYGVDISPRMLEIAKRKLHKAGLFDRVTLYCGDAVNLPFETHIFDAVFASFTLELFDTPEIPALLNELKRVLRVSGRISLVSMSKENGKSWLLNLYEWAHRQWPKYIDCRPIYLEKSLMQAGFKVQGNEVVNLFGLPCEIVLARI